MDSDDEWRALDEPFMQNDLHGPAEGPEWMIQRGARPLLFTAVHGVVHQRPLLGTKSAEARTGGLARVLGPLVGASIAVILRSTEHPDANFDPHHPLKWALVAQGLICPEIALIDLHGMTNERPVDIAIGRGPNPGLASPLADLAVAVFEGQGFAVDPDGERCGLTGSGPGTITTFAQGHGVVAIQVEIARRNRTFLTGADRRASLLQAFVELSERLEPLLDSAA